VTARVRAWLTWWLVLAVLWLVLVDRAPSDELVAGALAAALGATGAVLVREQREVLLSPRARWATRAWRPLLGLVTDLAPLVRVLWRRGIRRRRGDRGALVELRYAAVGDDGADAAHRVATAVLGSTAPNTVVVEVDVGRGVVLAHRLEAKGDAERAALPLGPGPA
jgi:multisubunit Na+/H+ antiporter MnhE subunit